MSYIFVYCIDEKMKDELLAQGYQLVKTEVINSQTTWIFKNKNDGLFDVVDKAKVFTSNAMRF